MIQASSYISPAALHIFFRYSFPSSFSLPFGHLLFSIFFFTGTILGGKGDLLFHCLLRHLLFSIFFFTELCGLPILTILGGKGDFSASFIILIVVFSTQLRCGVAGGGMLGPLRDPAPGSIISSGGLLMSKKKKC